MMKIEEIIQKILEADKAYYQGGTSILSDQEYDALKDYLRKEEPDHPLFSKVGSEPHPAWKKASHKIQMGSLNKVNTEEEFRKWASKYPGPYTTQFKLDGLSLSLIYRDSNFIQAITRGDGTEGEDITDNVRKMLNFVPIVEGFSGSVRGEIILPKKDFDRINSVLPEERKYSNCRNAASGISRRLDGNYCQYLSLITYDLIFEDGKEIDEDKKIDLLRTMGFVTTLQSVGDTDRTVRAFSQLKEKRSGLPYDIDGAVIKVCSGAIQKASGSSSNKPRAQIAWKFDPPGEITQLIEETWDVGRTGVVTPLGHVEPVEIEGSVIRKVTLHNIAEIKRLGIGRGDHVMLVKAGDIIPKVVSVIKHVGNPIEIPTVCPSCKEELVNDQIRLLCKNPACPKKGLNRILNWIKVVGIDYFGEALVGVLNHNGKLRSIADIYKLSVEDIALNEGWGEETALKVIESIKNTQAMKQETFLCALGIPSISEKTSRILINEFGSLETLMESTADQIKILKGFSDKSASKIIKGLQDHKGEIEDLLEVITFEKKDSGGVLSGKSFCFTGAMEKPRSYYQGIVDTHGGENKRSVTKDLDFLVCDQDNRSSKSVKAEKYGVSVITSEDFLNMVGEEHGVAEKVESISLFTGVEND